MIYLGVDPGVSGGLAAILPDGSALASKMPKEPSDILDWLLDVDSRAGSDEVFAILEQVTGYIPRPERKHMAHQGQPGHSMFSFGTSYGWSEMALISVCGTRYKKLVPRSWQSKVGAPARPKETSKEGYKRLLKEYAQSLFPQLTVTLATADALLLARCAEILHSRKKV